MAKEDFGVGLLQGLYNSGLGNPQVNEARRRRALEEAQIESQTAQSASERGMRPVNIQQIPGFMDKLKSALFPGGGQPLQTAFEPDPTVPKYAMSGEGEVKTFQPGQEVSSGFTTLSPKEGRTALMGQRKVGESEEFRREMREREESFRREMKSTGEPFGLTLMEKTVDREFAKEYATFVAKGGYSDVQKQLKQLSGVAKALEGRKGNYTGPGIALIPEKIKAFTHPKGIDLRNTVEEVVQRNLRLILGGQFAEREGENLIKRAYNEALPEKMNAVRVNRLIDQMKEAARAKTEAGAYYEKNGTLKGFTGRIYTSANDFLTDIDLSENVPDTEKKNGNKQLEDPLGIR